MADTASDRVAAGVDRRPPGQLAGIRRVLRAGRLTIQWTSRIMSWISGLLILVLMGLVVTEVILRKYFNTTVKGTIEYSEILLVFIVFAALAHAQQTGGHVKTELVTSRLPPRVAGYVRAVGLTVVAALLFWTTQATLARGLDSMEAGESRVGIREVPIWPARLAIPVSLFFLAIETLITAWDALRQGLGHEPVADIPPEGGDPNIPEGY